jgi:cilia- and flagella-associated protein 57
MHHWSWEKNKLVGSLKTTSNTNAEIHQLTVNPFDFTNTQICVTGNGIFRVFKDVDANYKLIHQQKPDKVVNIPNPSYEF